MCDLSLSILYRDRIFASFFFINNCICIDLQINISPSMILREPDILIYNTQKCNICCSKFMGEIHISKDVHVHNLCKYILSRNLVLVEAVQQICRWFEYFIRKQLAPVYVRLPTGHQDADLKIDTLDTYHSCTIFATLGFLTRQQNFENGHPNVADFQSNLNQNVKLSLGSFRNVHF